MGLRRGAPVSNGTIGSANFRRSRRLLLRGQRGWVAAILIEGCPITGRTGGQPRENAKDEQSSCNAAWAG
jgi:hypothetical protein